MRRLLPVLLSAMLWLCAAVDGYAQTAPQAGSAIDNQASVTYVDGASGQPSSLNSNAVKAFVQALVKALLSDAPDMLLTPGMEISWPYRLRNTGNARSVFWLTASNVPGADFDVTQIRVIHDLNEDGVASPGEPQIQSIELDPGESVSLVVVARAPSDIVAGRFARVLLRAVLDGGQLAAQSTAQAASTGHAVITLTQSAQSTSIVSGQIVSFQITANNTGADAQGVPVTVDGVTAIRVLLKWPIPDGSVLVDSTVPPQARLLYHTRGTVAGAYTSVPPPDLADVDMVAAAFDSFPGSSSVAVSVRVRATRQGTLAANASLDYLDQQGTGTLQAIANRSDVRVLNGGAVLSFYTSSSYGRVARSLQVGDSIFLQASAAACNMDTAIADTITFRVDSLPSGDSERYTAHETGPDTGIFQLSAMPLTASADAHGTTSGNNVIETRSNDRLVATVEGCNAVIDPVTIYVDPYGVVFDSRSDLPVGNTRVELIDVTGQGNGGQAGGLATVYQDDGVTSAPASIVTSANGEYRFPLVAPSTYRLRVTAPGTHIFPSTFTTSELPAGRTIDGGSYGQDFVIASASPPIRLDVPMDIKAATGLMLEKTASRQMAEPGDFIDYRVRVRNVSGGPLNDVVLSDTLPRGMAYLRGSHRRDGRAQADPEGGMGPSLRFAPFAMAQGATVVVSYRVRVEATVAMGDAVNSVQASNRMPLPQISNVAQAKVRIEGGVFDARGFIAGTVFADCDRDGLQGRQEPGVPGVRIWLEDGTFAITDGMGRYSFYGVRPITHVAKLDPVTLPEGARPVPLDNRHMGDGASRFVDLRNGELMRADFALTPCGASLDAAIAQRRERLNAPGPLDDEMRPAAPDELVLDGMQPRPDPRSQPSSGIVQAAGRLSLGMSKVPAPMPARLAPMPDPKGSSRAEALATLEDTMREAADATPAIVEPRDGAVMPTRQTRVRVKGLMGAPFSLSVNGEGVPEQRLGRQITDPARRLVMREYVGIDLRVGDNVLVLEQRDTFGQVRERQVIHVRAPGELDHIAIDIGQMSADADGGMSVPVSIRLEDKQGLPVTERTPLTLNSAMGTWLTPDLQPAEPGWQVFIEGGRDTLRLRVPDQQVTDTLTAVSGMVRGQARLSVAPPLREMVGVGIVEGVLNLRGLKGLQRARSRDGFEEELAGIAGTDGRMTGRTALFLKGKIKGDRLLTLAYDSDKDTKERLFRDIQPDRFYPVYGDASVKGYDAQLTSKLYVRVDQNKSWLLHGDFNTPPATPERKLSAYSRSLTGIRHHLETDALRVDSFASRDNSRQVIEELPGNGTSGPYLLNGRAMLENSEQVEILIRDRAQPSRVIEVKPQVRFTDYEVEPYSGRLLFRTPVPSLDPDLNPVSVRVTYEVEQGGAAFWVGGVEAQAKISDAVSAGASHVVDENPEDHYQLSGANVVWRDGGLTMTMEIAQSQRDSLGEGKAQRVEVESRGEDLNWQVYAARTDPEFDNPGALLSRGRNEASAKMSYALNERTRVVLDAIHSSLSTTGELRQGAEVAVQRSLDGGMKLEVGLRTVRERAGSLYGGGYAATYGVPPPTGQAENAADPAYAFTPATEADPQGFQSVRAKLTSPVPGLQQATAFVEAEQAIGDAERRMVGLGGDYRFSDTGRAYARYELISSLTSTYDLNSQERRNVAMVGIDGQYMEDGRAFSEYRARDAFEGRQTEASMGLRNGFKLADGLRMNTTLERVHALSEASASREATAVTGALAYTADPDWKATGRLEYRFAPTSKNVLWTAGLAWRLSDAWTAMVREIINVLYSDQPATGDRFLSRVQGGLAWRDADHIWTALTRYELKTERDTTEGTGFDRRAHIASLHVNMKATRALTVSGRYGLKLARDRSLGLDSDSITQLVAGRLLYDISERWDMGLQASRLFTDGGAAQQGLGAEVGYRVKANLWLSLGHNVQGFREVDLSGDQTTDRGPYMRLRFKFDETLWSGS